MMGGAALTAGAALRVDAHPELGCVTRQRTSDALVHVVTARAAFPACPAVARAVSEVTGQRVGGDTGAGLVAVGSVLRFIRATCAKQLSEGSFKVARYNERGAGTRTRTRTLRFIKAQNFPCSADFIQQQQH